MQINPILVQPISKLLIANFGLSDNDLLTVLQSPVIDQIAAYAGLDTQLEQAVRIVKRKMERSPESFQ